MFARDYEALVRGDYVFIKNEDGSQPAEFVNYNELVWGRNQPYFGRCGVFLNRQQATVLIDGKEVGVRTSYLVPNHPVDERVKALSLLQEKDADFIRDLPDTKAWEGDTIVIKPNSRAYEVESVHTHRELGVPYYVFHRDDGSYDEAFDDDISAVKRGNIWLMAHGEKTFFNSVREESAFHILTGRADQIEAKDLSFGFNLCEALDAIASGRGDAIHERDLALNERGFRVTVHKLHDKEVGQRVARFMLEAFGRV